MTIQTPDITRAAEDSIGIGGNIVIGAARCREAGLAGFIQNHVDLGETEPSKLEFKLIVDQCLELDGEDLGVPAGVERQLVIRDYVCAALGIGQI